MSRPSSPNSRVGRNWSHRPPPNSKPRRKRLLIQPRQSALTAAKLAEAEKALTVAKANAAAAPKLVEARTNELKAATDKSNAAHAAANAASANLLAVAKKVVDAYKALPPKK